MNAPKRPQNPLSRLLGLGRKAPSETSQPTQRENPPSLDDCIKTLSHAQIGALLLRASLRSVQLVGKMQGLNGLEADIQEQLEDEATYLVLNAGPLMAAAVLAHDQLTRDFMLSPATPYATAAAQADIQFEGVPTTPYQTHLMVTEELLYLADEWHHEAVTSAIEFTRNAASGFGKMGTGQSMRSDVGFVYLGGSDPESVVGRRVLLGDALALRSGESVADLLDYPLWRDEIIPQTVQTNWQTTKAALAACERADWSIWIDWHDDRLQGQPLDHGLMKSWHENEIASSQQGVKITGSSRSPHLTALVARHGQHPPLEDK